MTEQPTIGVDGGTSEIPMIVGVGASAGGISALKRLFERVPPGSGCAWVVILHLSPDHESRLAEVIQGGTTLHVAQVVDGAELARDHIYVIPPNKSLTATDRTLVLSDIEHAEERRSPVDVFFRALAESQRTRSAAVILSGTGPNGSSGLKRVKEYGGLVIAQDPAEAEYDGMPRHAIATGLVDFILPVADIPEAIFTYARHRQGHPPIGTDPESLERSELDTLRVLLALVRAQTGHDFSNYKVPTVLRRVARRIHLHGLSSIAEYLEFVRSRPAESPAFVKEMLISVTNFFRDRTAFNAMAQTVIPQLFQGRRVHQQLRIWIPGCASGEEAYSVAMLLTEHAATLDAPPPVQLFATDLDEAAIADARAALYSEADVVDVSPERLRKHFVREGDRYRIPREIRELVLFATHNVLKDPPFSHLDMVCCRNLLIYLDRTAQEHVLDLFHFALNPGGYLFLGSAESIDTAEDLFVPIDKSARIYQCRPLHARASLALPHLVSPPPSLAPVPSPPRQVRNRDWLLPGDVHMRLLEELGPPSILISSEQEVVHVSDSAARYLQISGGEPSRDLLKLIDPDLRIELRAALYEASQTRQRVEIRDARVRVDGRDDRVRIVVRPIGKDNDPARGFFLLLFHGDPVGESAPIERPLESPGAGGDASRHVEEELMRVKAQLRSTIEQHEMQAAEFRAANEELQSVNEEIRSSTEELETSKEELQSSNEELTTVNQELKIKIEELGLANNDFQNLMNSTDIGTIFLDRRLRIKLSTPRARDVFNILPSDMGRPLSDITTRLVYDELESDVHRVLDDLQTIEREVSTRDDRWYLIRVLPYRTTDDRIDGVVITSLDTTERRRALQQVRGSEARLLLLIDSARDYAIFTLRPGGEIDSWNKGAERMYGYSEAEILGQPFSTLFTPEDRAEGKPTAVLERAARFGRVEEERWHVRKDGTRFISSGVTHRLGDDPRLGYAKIARDLTAQREMEQRARDASARMEAEVADRTLELRAEVSERVAAEARVRNVMRQLVTAQEDERARVARDLHDQMGQQLTALRLLLERLQERSAEASGNGREDLSRAQALVKDMDEGLEFMAWELRPAALDDLGLTVVLPRYIREWSTNYGIDAEFRSTSLGDARLPREAELAFFRVAQEALTNVAKHAKARHIGVLLERRDGMVTLIIEDDGVGFETSTLSDATGLGVIGMRERALLIGAALDVESSPTHGTTVYLRLPYQAV